VIYRENAPPDDVRLAELNEAVKRNVHDVGARAQLAMLQLDVGDLDAAQKNFRVLLLQALSGTSLTKADVFHKLAVIAAKRGERDKAIAMAKSAIDLDATHADARSLLALIERA
jgi:Tfp pilus assembly protein PilF